MKRFAKHSRQQFLENRVRLVRQLLVSGPEVAYADLVLILTAVLSACAAIRWPSNEGDRIDKSRFVELLVALSPTEARAGNVSIPALLASKLITEAQTPWGEPGQSCNIYRGEEIDYDVDSAARAFPALSKRELKKHSYACLIYEWLRCGYAHEYFASEWVTTMPPSREKTQVSYIGQRTPSGFIRISCFHLDYLIDLTNHHVQTLPARALARPNKWWLNAA